MTTQRHFAANSMLTGPRKYIKKPGLKIEYLCLLLEVKSNLPDVWTEWGKYRTMKQVMYAVRRGAFKKSGWKFRITEL